MTSENTVHVLQLLLPVECKVARVLLTLETIFHEFKMMGTPSWMTSPTMRLTLKSMMSVQSISLLSLLNRS